jgi:RNA polymerase-binding transcription factor DksA
MPKSKNDKAAAKPSVKKETEADAAAAEVNAAVKKEAKPSPRPGSNHFAVITPAKEVEIKDPFLKRQKERLLQLRDGMLDSMSGVARDTLRSRAEGSEASAFGMHQADAGSDAYDRDFALSLLSQEQDALYEIDEALKRIELGTYGICELCNKPILHARLEAIPFARFTVDCQSQLEKQRKMTRSRQPVTSLFGLTDEEGGSSEGEEEETVSETKE